MRLQEHQIEFLFNQGIDTDTHEYLLPPGSFSDIQNMVQNEAGCLEKRFGTTAVASGVCNSDVLSTIQDLYCASGYSVHSVEEQAILIGDWYASRNMGGGDAGAGENEDYSSGPQCCALLSDADEANGNWVYLNRSMRPVDFKTTRITSNTGDAESAAISYVDPWVHVLCVASGHNAVSEDIYELESHTRLHSRNLASSATWKYSHPKAVVCGQRLVAVAFLNRNNPPLQRTLYGRCLTLDTLRLFDNDYYWSIELYNSADYETLWDMCEFNEDNIAICYVDTNENLYCKIINPETEDVLAQGNLLTSNLPVTWVKMRKLIIGTTQYLGFLYSDGTNVKFALYDPLTDLGTSELSPISVFTHVDAATYPPINGTMTVVRNTSVALFISYPDDTGNGLGVYNTSTERYTESLTEITYGASDWHDCYLVSEAFTHKNDALVWLAQNHTNWCTYYLKDSSRDAQRTHRTDYIGHIFRSNAGDHTTVPTDLPAVLATSNANEYIWCGLRSSAIGTNGQTIEAVEEVRITLDTPHSPSLKVGKRLLIGGGATRQWDGSNIEDLGIPYAPQGLALNSVAATGGELPDGTYSYKALFSWQDRLGAIQRSPASDPLEVTVASGTQTQAVTLDCIGLTQSEYWKFSEYSPSYGSNLLSYGNIELYRTTANGTTYYRTNSTTPNDPRHDQAPVTLNVDGISDADIASNEELYENVEVSTLGPPAAVHMCLHKNRVLLIPMDDRKSLWYSHAITEGHGIEFSDSLVTRRTNDDMTSVFSLDEKAIVATADNLYYFLGDGATRAGTDEQWTDCYPIHSEVGIASWRDAQTIPEGLIWHSSKGIHLLSRDLTVHHITAPEDFKTKTVRFSVKDSNTKRVRWVFTDNTALVYDWKHKCFYDWTNQADISGTMWGSTYLGITNTTIHKESTAYLDDDYQQIDTLIDTGWIKTNSITGFGRLWKLFLLGEYVSSHTLSVSVYYDYSSTASETVTKSITYDPGPYLMEIRPSRQRCTAFRLRIETTGASGGAAKFVGLRATIGVKRKTPSTSNRRLGG